MTIKMQKVNEYTKELNAQEKSCPKQPGSMSKIENSEKKENAELKVDRDKC